MWESRNDAYDRGKKMDCRDDGDDGGDDNASSSVSILYTLFWSDGKLCAIRGNGDGNACGVCNASHPKQSASSRFRKPWVFSLTGYVCLSTDVTGTSVPKTTRRSDKKTDPFEPVFHDGLYSIFLIRSVPFNASIRSIPVPNMAIRHSVSIRSNWEAIASGVGAVAAFRRERP